MAKTLQHRRGTTAELSAITGAAGEIFYDTDKDTLVVMDGSLAGGYPLEKAGAGTGATGAAGAAGATGAAGANGSNGSNGATGPQGVQGASGVGGGGGGSYTSLTENTGAKTLTVDKTYGFTSGDLYVAGSVITPLDAVVAGPYGNSNVAQPVTINGKLKPLDLITFPYGDNSKTKITWQLNTSGTQIGNLTIAAGTNAIQFGRSAGNTNQSTEAIAIGMFAGSTNQMSYAVALGSSAGQADQSANSVAIGNQAALQYQGGSAVAIGDGAGRSNQGAAAIAIGASAGYQGQGQYSICIGQGASSGNNTGNYAIAIGSNAQALVTNAVAIGKQATAAAASVILNASGANLDDGNTAGFYVKPVRAITNTAGHKAVYFNTTTNEIVYYNV
jgi:hypothetical protein